MFYDRARLLLSQVEFVRPDPNFQNLIIGLIFIFFMLIQLKDKKYRQIYFSFLYFYVGFYALTLINKGPILYFYMYPFFPLVFLMFSSFITSRIKYLFLVVFIICYAINFHTAIAGLHDSQKFIGKDQNSWKFLNNMATRLYSFKDKSFAYFVYTPDVIGYAPKYALFYQQKLHPQVNATYLVEKKPITYIVVAPPAPDNPYLSYEWWKENTINIKKNPVLTVNFPNGYKIEKYNLTPAEIAEPYDKSYDPGLGFR
jgi:hypothetical protein